MRICMIHDNIFPDHIDECTDCKNDESLIPAFPETPYHKRSIWILKSS